MTTLSKTIITIGCIGLFTSCFDTKKIEQDLSAISDSMKIIQKKLDDFEKKQKTIASDIALLKKSNGGKKNNSRKEPDPNKVYSAKIGNSFVQGNKDAKVTIIEWADYF
jgi:protein-disulfide isomerase